MATVVRTTTVRTTTTGGGHSIRMIPIWSIKLITAIIALLALILILILHSAIWQYYVTTFIILVHLFHCGFLKHTFWVLTCGFLLGWALPPVLNRFLTFHRSDMITHGTIAILSVVSLVLCASYLLHNDYYKHGDNYKIMVGVTICMAVEALICCVLVSWICFGNYTIVETR